ncbi:MAG TPA: hypothetical protein VNN62_23305 [Methylomirabilota bacterium]|jgi:hypothetical protein|nr:hypothetical protein [Methylomirabilota bacterium]
MNTSKGGRVVVVAFGERAKAGPRKALGVAQFYLTENKGFSSLRVRVFLE